MEEAEVYEISIAKLGKKKQTDKAAKFRQRKHGMTNKARFSRGVFYLLIYIFFFRLAHES